MRIWIDADACPGAVSEIIFKAVFNRKVPATFVANKVIRIPESPLLAAVRVEAGPDVADAYIAEHAQPGDLVISQDIPLASELVTKKVSVISPYGTVFTEANMGNRLSNRDLMQDLRDAGLVTGGGPKPFGDREKRAFANAFDQALTRMIKDRDASAPDEPQP